jgi:uncharacterized protein
LQYDFEWNPDKARINIKKHNVSFEHAATIFKDPRVISVYDDGHSANEDRWVSMGLAFNGVLLVVHHTYRQINDKTVILRIISSRKATKREEKQYEEE